MTFTNDLPSIVPWDRRSELDGRWHDEGRVWRMRLYGGLDVWVLGEHAEARALLSDDRLAKDAQAIAEASQAKLRAAGKQTERSGMLLPSMLNADGETHTRLRRLLQKDFTAHRIRQLRPRVEQITTRLLDALPTDQPVDLIEHFAFTLPLTVICELLGVPAEDHGRLREWSPALADDDPAVILPASRAMAEYFVALIAAKRAAPDDALVSALTNPASSDDRLSEEELLGTLFLILVAGHETTTNWIGNGARWLLADPAAWRRLGQDPELIPGALEEILRFDGPVRHTAKRVTLEPVDYGGYTIPAGEIVLASVSAANRDASQYREPDTLDIDRRAAHLSFGHGVHFCLGAPLARMEAEIAFSQLTQRFPAARLADDPFDRTTSTVINGYRVLRVLLE